MYKKSSKYYDIIFFNKKYEEESSWLQEFILKKKPDAKLMLNLASGTGNHDCYLTKHFMLTGIDINAHFVNLAKGKNPSVTYIKGNMINFNIQKKFDVITSLFSSIAALKNINSLPKMIACCKKHLCTGGLLIIEPFIEPTQWINNLQGMKTFDTEKYKYAILSKSGFRKNRGFAKEYHTYIDENGEDIFSETFEFSLFRREEIKEIFINMDFEYEYLENDIFKRGLHIGSLSR